MVSLSPIPSAGAQRNPIASAQAPATPPREPLVTAPKLKVGSGENLSPARVGMLERGLSLEARSRPIRLRLIRREY